MEAKYMKNNKKRLNCLSYLLGFVIASWQFSVSADDSEIYSSSASAANPNILFLLDTSGSMKGKDVDDGNGNLKKRLDVVKEVFRDVITNAPPNLNIGLMRYGGEMTAFPSGVSFPVKAIDSEALPVIAGSIALDKDNLPDPVAGQTVRSFLPSVVDSWEPLGATPIVDSLTEVARYYRGEKLSWFSNLPADRLRAAHPSTYTGSSSFNECAAYSEPTDCNNTKGECTGEVVAGSCHNEMVEGECAQWADKPGTCCEESAPTGYDEFGSPTGWQCLRTTSCTERYCEVAGPQVSNEICQHKTCYNGMVGEPTYISPMTSECQSNYLVFMSDGRPEGWNGPEDYPDSDTLIESTIGKTCETAPSGYNAGTCGPELAEYLANEDQSPTLDGKQTIETFTIAFALNDPDGTKYLKSLAEAGHLKVADNGRDLRNALKHVLAQAASGKKLYSSEPVYAAARPFNTAKLVAQAATDQSNPLVSTWALWKSFLNNPDLAQAMLKLIEPSVFTGGSPSLAATNNNFFHANNVKDLTTAFTSIIGRVQAASSSFASPTYKVDPNSYLAHSDEIFIPVFARTKTARWSGNLKKFKLQDGMIVGKSDTGTNQAAVDAKGQFLDSAWDFWGAAASGSGVTEGGAASLLDPAARVIYTNTTSSLIPLDNTLNKAALGNAAMSDADRDALIQFARGYETDGSTLHYLGDIMNSKPVMVRDSHAKSYVLAGSNDGYLHAFDSETGLEKWAFMPAVLLKNLKALQADALTKDHLYGVDGPLSIWYDDKNNDGLIKPDDGEKIYVYFGLRRGGRAYYALDITDMSAPTLAWAIDNTTTGFNNLGESWSKPALAKMRVIDPADSSKSLLKDVLVIGGGFDPLLENEDPSTRTTHTIGNDVYIVDARNGSDLIWSLRQHVSSASLDLRYSIPSDIRILDMDRNGALDRLYFGDTGGNVWRVDMDVDVKDAEASTLYDYTKARLTKFAELGGSGTDKRMFYYEPDVAVTRIKGKDILTLAIGSGYRSHPMSEVIDDRFYVLMDRQPFAEPDTTVFPLKETSSLVSVDTLDASNNLLTDDTLTGWYYDLPNKAEKVLAAPLTFMNKIIFTTFAVAETSGASTTSCDVSTSVGRAYVMDLFSGIAVATIDPEKPDEKVRSTVIGLDEIPDTPQIVFKQPQAAAGGACTETDCVQGLEVRIGKMQQALLSDANMNTGSTVSEQTGLGNLLPRLFWLDRDVNND